MIHDGRHASIGDLVIINTGILGKIAYKITSDFLHIRLVDIENDLEYNQLFNSLEELENFIDMNSSTVELVTLHS